MRLWCMTSIPKLRERVWTVRATGSGRAARGFTETHQQFHTDNLLGDLSGIRDVLNGRLLRRDGASIVGAGLGFVGGGVLGNGLKFGTRRDVGGGVGLRLLGYRIGQGLHACRRGAQGRGRGVDEDAGAPATFLDAEQKVAESAGIAVGAEHDVVEAGTVEERGND